ncbi:cytochrome c oxidase assembly protein [Deinococcus sp.]|uniref:cytochrome c oxidase assembly protein n=1 Tax=Deinococcus sp. TaxID=47478 RepID=UPI0025BA37DE|nr:cytochrome c oxidase assembly protein [Deinococcus sp.]
MTASGGINLNPGLLDLLTFRPDWPMLVALLLVGGVYFWQYAAAHNRNWWPAWKVALFSLGLLLWFLTTQSQSNSLTGQSMALYMARLMMLAEVVPPLLVLGLPQIRLDSRRGLGQLLGLLLDPWVALAVWAAVIIFWNIPAGFNASVVTNSAAQLLPALYLISSLMVWGVILRPLPGVQPAHVGSRGWFGLLAAVPMMTVAAIWLYTPRVLYTPYVSALCLWNLSPLQNQQYAGWIMMVAGLPSLFLAFGQLMLWLIKLADGDSLPKPPRS